MTASARADDEHLHDTTPESGLRHPPLSGRLIGAYVLMYAVLTGLFTGLGFLVVDGLDGTAVSRFDDRVTDWFVEQRTTTLDTATDIGSALSDTLTVIVAATIVCLVMLFAQRRWHETVLIGGALLLETLAFVSASALVGRDRPDVEQLDVSPPTASFPSGHEGAAVAFYTTLAIVVGWHARSAILRGLFVLIAVVVPVVVALSRLYRGMHYLTDVVAGAALGLLAVVVVYQIVRLGTERLAAKHAAGDRRIPADTTRLVLRDRR